MHGKPLGKDPPRYRPTPASRATAAPRELSWRATGATSTQCPGAASTTAPAGCAASPWGTLWTWRGRGDVLQPQELLPRSPATHHAPMGHVVAVPHVGTMLCSPSARATKRRASTWGACSPQLCPLTQQSSPAQHGAAGRRLPGELSCTLPASRAWPWGLLLLLLGCSLSAACLGSIKACLILLVTRLHRGLAFLLLYLQLP